ncbi:PorP/SprF family type IX secretion system membrane protein [Pontibacter sp. SGAir0037]|uniref:PorP/SprF family type IX secretion system membrane protein n=1 Tax=Pontibacter sp. SGAir0037 TaxID=2571030 RepID=UPI0010CD1607|nr:PorP/SprF family type IX secretion system membrane protein [Pontibacter sp. SGAir0037]QCR23982.1 hypothetical protein C1N53_17585 [Pontibacter sp. SGAir0037]
MVRKVISSIMLLLLLCLYKAIAQDANFTQQYANRLYLNPAFAGLNHDWSVTASHRDQWPSLNGSFITSQIAADFRVPDKKSSFGVLVQRDRAGIGGLQNVQAGAIYAYSTNINDKWAFAAGLQATVASLRVNYDNLVFGDQLSDNGAVALTSAEVYRFEPTSYVSFTTGGLIYTNQFWFSFTAAHLNKPNFGFGETTTLPIRFTASTGYKFYAKTDEKQGELFELSFTPVITYTQQQDLRRTDLGFYTIYTPFTLGLIYRGVPVTGSANQDQTLAVIAGLQFERFKVGFSHDVGLKGFGRQVGGANEISVSFEQIDLGNLFRSRSGRRISRNIVCPSF